MTTVSLCMIVRDEAAVLEDCLRSAAPLVSEMIVVDTGSRDDTVAIAERHGARVLHFAWIDDFAAARNESLRHASGDWVLVLDADERLGPRSVERIRHVLGHYQDFDCGMLRLHDAVRLDAAPEEVVSGAARIGDPMFVPRLLRRTADLAFSGIVHENVRPWLAAHGNRMRDAGGDIVHLGAVPAQRQSRSKGDRNTRLLEKRLALEPDDFTVHGYIAHEYLGAGEIDRAWAMVEQGWELVRRASPDTLRSALRLAAARVVIQLSRSDAAGALATVADAVAYEGQQPDLDFFAGRAHEMLAAQNKDDAELERAARAYEACLAQRDRLVAQRYVRGGSSWAGATRLATVRLVQGRAAEARQLFARALADKGDVLETQLGLAEALLESGDADKALAELEPLVAGAAKELPDGWLLAAATADELGSIDDFKRCLADARERAKTQSYLAPHRNLRHGALHAQLLAYLGRPTGGDGAVGTATALLAGEAPRTRGVAVREADRRTLRAFARNLLRLGRSAEVERLLSDEADAALPGVRALVIAAVEDLGMSVEQR